MQDYEVPILVVGGSLVGTSTALLLGHHGVESLVVERHPGAAIHPRAALLLQRTMEILRSVGVEQIVRGKSIDQFEPDGALMAVETLAGKEIAYYIPKLNEGVRDLSPSERMFITQILLEPLSIGEGDGDGAVHGNPRESRGRPGSRAPHVFLDRDGEQVSTLDLFGLRFSFARGIRGGHLVRGRQRSRRGAGRRARRPRGRRRRRPRRSRRRLRRRLRDHRDRGCARKARRLRRMACAERRRRLRGGGPIGARRPAQPIRFLTSK
jgi:FAD binding domain